MPWGQTLLVLDRSNTDQDALDAAANALFDLFLVREKDFGIGEGVLIARPDLLDQGDHAFLNDAAGYIARAVAEAEKQGDAISDVAVLTTYGERIGAALDRAGFRTERVDMPAGPDHTAIFRLERARQGQGRTLYIEAVNEADPKIRPAFALMLSDSGGTLAGGACGSLTERDGRRYCYLATLTVAEGQPSGTGQWLDRQLDAYLKARNVDRIDVGTQTAGPFYEKVGYRIVHTVVPRLRTRMAGDGRMIAHDLVLLSRDMR